MARTAKGRARSKARKPASAETEARILGALSQRGSSLVPAPPGVAAAGAFLLARQDAQPGPEIAPAATVERLVRRGWIGPAGSEGALGLTPAGRVALRRLRSSLATVRARLALEPPSAAVAARPAMNPAESPLGWLAGRRDAEGRPLLERSQVEAGERLRADLTFAGLMPRITMGWSGIPGAPERAASAAGHGRDIADNVIAARARATAALEAVGPEHASLLIDVCGHLRGLDEIARAEGWPKRAGRLLLQRALSALARHYGLEPRAKVEETIARRLRHWGAEGYRPPLPPRREPQAD